MDSQTARTNLKKRNTTLDIIRVVSVFSVISVHFFLYNGFYSTELNDLPMFIQVLVRTFFNECVPMFIVLTGYLMCKKTLSKKYYSGIKKTLGIYLLCSIACLIFKMVDRHQEFTPKTFVFEILNYSGAQYAWYIEMYICLFLIIPFLNLAYNGLKTQKQKQILVLTMFFITTLPTFTNSFNFNDLSWWVNPTSSDEFTKILPAFWLTLYPITYYFVGAYLREFGLKIKTKSLVILLLMTTFLFGVFNFYRSYNGNFKTGAYNYWYGIVPFLITLFFFELLRRIDTRKMSHSGKWIFWKLSDLSLSIFLLSYIFDTKVYEMLNKKVLTTQERTPYYLACTVIVFTCATAASILIHLIYNAICRACAKIYAAYKDGKLTGLLSPMNLCFYVLLIGAFVFSIWKCKYGMGGDDEPFYLATAHRLTLGDALFRHEWHVSQMSSILMVPFVALFRLFTGSMVGIIFTARIFYTIIHSLVAVFMFWRLRQYGWMSVVASIIYLLFVPFGIMAYSYNSMALDLLVSSGLLLATFSTKRRLPFILAGVTFAMAVLCNPYLVIVFALYVVFVILGKVLKNAKYKGFLAQEEIFSFNTFVKYVIGLAIVLVIFLILIVSRTGISDMFANIKYILEDPEHVSYSLTFKITTMFKSLANSVDYFKFILIAFGITLFVLAADRRRMCHRSGYLAVAATLTTMSLFLYHDKLVYSNYNSIMFPMIFVGIVSYILLKDKPKKIFYALFIVGILYGLCVTYSSNQYYYVFSMAGAIYNTASIIFAGLLIREIKKTPDVDAYGHTIYLTSIVCVALASFILLTSNIIVKEKHVFWEGEPSTLMTKITTGPAKGIYTTADNANVYETIEQDINQIKTREPGRVLILSKHTSAYLSLNNWKYATFSAWQSGETPTTLERLRKYFDLNPEMVPKYIYIRTDSTNATWDIEMIKSDAQSQGYTIEDAAGGYIMSK